MSNHDEQRKDVLLFAASLISQAQKADAAGLDRLHDWVRVMMDEAVVSLPNPMTRDDGDRLSVCLLCGDVDGCSDKCVRRIRK